MYIIADKNYLLNPVDAYYTNDTEISDLPEIQEMHEYVIGIEDKIEGDFDLSTIRFEFFYNQYSFVRDGLLLSKVKFFRLYDKCSCFKEYCQEVLHKSTWQINHIINASRVFLELMYAGFEILPANIAQGQVLAHLTGEELIHSWRTVIESKEPHQITANSIREVLCIPTVSDKKSAKLDIPADLHNELIDTARAKGFSLHELIRVLLYFFLTGGKGGDNTHCLSTYDNTQNFNQNKPSEEEDIAKYGGVVTY